VSGHGGTLCVVGGFAVRMRSGRLDAVMLFPHSSKGEDSR
jgi:hypothetical protein